MSEFNKNPDRKCGYRSECRECKKIGTRLYRDNNKDKIKERNRLYRDRIKNPEKYSKRVKLTLEQRNKNKSEYSTKYILNRSKNDLLFKVKVTIRSRISWCFKNGTKMSKTIDILGMPYEDFKLYIESLFKEGMTWDNYGEWQLDHKIPISWASTIEEIHNLNHYTNFQPMWAKDNLSKGNRFSS